MNDHLRTLLHLASLALAAGDTSEARRQIDAVLDELPDVPTPEPAPLVQTGWRPLMRVDRRGMDLGPGFDAHGRPETDRRIES